MLKFMLAISNNSVVASSTSGDHSPGGYAVGLVFDVASFIVGIGVGVIATLIVWGIIKYAKWIVEDNKKMKEKLFPEDK